jgi:hypothetical protein
MDVSVGTSHMSDIRQDEIALPLGQTMQHMECNESVGQIHGKNCMKIMKYKIDLKGAQVVR